MEEKEVNKDETSKIKNEQTKINLEIKVSRNFNTITFGIQDEPINSINEEEFRSEIRNKMKILREEAEEQLRLIGSQHAKNEISK